MASKELMTAKNGQTGEKSATVANELSDTHDPQVALLEVHRRGQSSSEIIPLFLSSRLRYGRDSSANSADEASFSRDHFEFYVVNFDASTRPMCYVRDRQSTNGFRVNGQHVGYPDRLTPGYLLQDGDRIDIPGTPVRDPRAFEPCLTFHFRQSSQIGKPPAWTETQRLETMTFSDQFLLTDRVIGEGANARVHLAFDIRDGMKKQVVCKFMDLETLPQRDNSEKTASRCRQEPNIVEFVHAFESPHTLYCFTELAAGGDLFSFVSHREIGVAYLHEHGVVHRDLKPENVLFAVRPAPEYRVVLSDFGHSGLTRRRLKSMVGTRPYMSPEMYKNHQEHERPVDVWGIGTIMLFLINSQEMTALAVDLCSLTQEMVEQVIQDISASSRMDVSQIVKDLARACLTVDWKSRPTAQQAKADTWFDQSRHKARLDTLRESIRLSWNATKKVLPGTERLADFGTVVIATHVEPQPLLIPPSASPGGLTASKYFGDINFGSPSHQFKTPRIEHLDTEQSASDTVDKDFSVGIEESFPREEDTPHAGGKLKRSVIPLPGLGDAKGHQAGVEPQDLVSPVSLKRKRRTRGSSGKGA